jgi:hypothetical protein
MQNILVSLKKKIDFIIKWFIKLKEIIIRKVLSFCYIFFNKFCKFLYLISLYNRIKLKELKKFFKMLLHTNNKYLKDNIEKFKQFYK